MIDEVITARRLTPPGTGAVSVILLEPRPARSPLVTASGRPMPWPAAGRVRFARLMHGDSLVDEVLAVGTETGVELHVHGGPGVEHAVWAALELPRLEQSPPSAPASLAEARARASLQDGPLASLAERARVALAAGAVSPELARQAAAVLGRAPRGARLARAPVVALVGRPNAGKSTLFNALLATERSLTSPVAGTTRDPVRAVVLLAGVPVVLEDRAGAPASSPERADARDQVDLRLHLLADEAWPDPRPGVVAVWGQLDRRPRKDGRLAVSGRTGDGLARLVAVLVEVLGLAGSPADDALTPLPGPLLALLEQVAAGNATGPA